MGSIWTIKYNKIHIILVQERSKTSWEVYAPNKERDHNQEGSRSTSN